MVVEAVVLLGIQHLQKGGGRISLVIAADLVNLIQQHQRIFHPRLPHTGRDAAGHGAHIGPSVSPNLRLIPDAAQGNAHVFLIQSSGNGAGNGCLSGSGRSHQADNRAASLLGQNPHGEKFQHPLLHLFHSIVIFIQNLLCPLQVCAVSRCLIPGKLQQGLDISPDYCAFRGIVPYILKTRNFLFNLLLNLSGCFQLCQLFPEMIGIGARRIFSQLFPDHFQLLPQQILSLVLVHPGLHFFLKFPFKAQNFYLLIHLCAEKLIAVRQSHCLQKLLLILVIKGKVDHDLLHQLLQIRRLRNLAFQLLPYLSAFPAVQVKCLGKIPNHSLSVSRVQILQRVLTLKTDYLCLQKLSVLGKMRQLCFLQSFCQHPDYIVRQLDYLLHRRDGADTVQILRPRLLYLNILLSYQKDPLFFQHGLLNGLYRTFSAYIKMYYHTRKNGHSPQRHYG